MRIECEADAITSSVSARLSRGPCCAVLIVVDEQLFPRPYCSYMTFDGRNIVRVAAALAVTAVDAEPADLGGLDAPRLSPPLLLLLAACISFPISCICATTFGSASTMMACA